MELIIIIVALLALLGIGVPIAFATGLVGVIGLTLAVGPNIAIDQLGRTALTHIASIGLVTLPMFIFMAELITYSGLAEGLFGAAEKWVGRVPGGLGIATCLTNAVFGTMTGSTAAATVTIGRIAIPEMLKRGYDRRLATGCVACAGSLASLIPPSITMIVYATVAQTSVVRLFAAGIVPGIVLTSIFSLIVLGQVLLDPAKAPKMQETFTWKERLASLKGVGPGILVVAAVLGTVFAGIATPTESAAIGAFIIFLMALSRRSMSSTQFFNACLSTLKTTCFILIMIVGIQQLNFLLAYLGLPQQILKAVTSWNFPGIWVILIIQLVYVVMGCFLDPIGMVLLTMPVVIPVLHGFGFDPVWFGILLVINTEMAVITPPVAVLLYIVQGLAPEVPLSDVIRGTIPFLIGDFVCIVLVMVFPALALWLPSLMYG